jgi:hypothetical protein
MFPRPPIPPARAIMRDIERDGIMRQPGPPVLPRSGAAVTWTLPPGVTRTAPYTRPPTGPAIPADDMPAGGRTMPGTAAVPAAPRTVHPAHTGPAPAIQRAVARSAAAEAGAIAAGPPVAPRDSVGATGKGNQAARLVRSAALAAQGARERRRVEREAAAALAAERAIAQAAARQAVAHLAGPFAVRPW